MRKILFWAGIACAVAGLALSIYNIWRNRK